MDGGVAQIGGMGVTDDAPISTHAFYADYACVPTMRITSDFLNAPELRIPPSSESTTHITHGFGRVLQFFGLAG